MFVHAITIDPDSNSPILLLREKGGEKTLPIWIGVLEATAIATEMEKIQFTRPMTHDCIINVIKAMDAQVPRIEITELKDNTYYAVITIKSGEKEVVVDARPSDAVAVALRAGSEIFVTDTVLDKAIPHPVTIAESEELTEEKKKWADILEGMNPDAYKYKA
jgi:bifunctional DNase/RNase